MEITTIAIYSRTLSKYEHERDGIWHGIKKYLADSINEITSIWMCGVKNRIIAHGNMIYSYKDEDCCAELLGFKRKISKTLDRIISKS